MQDKRYYYLIQVQFLGYRYSGWQKQPGQKTVEGMLLKTLRYILPSASIKILGAGRTDAKVSAQNAAFELFTDCEVEDASGFMQEFNRNLPPDIRVVQCKTVNKKFNVIKDIKEKQYQYFFSFGQKNHPFCAPFMANIIEDLDIEKMKTAAALFEGKHNFKCYSVKSQKKVNYERILSCCRIDHNTVLKANFFPESSYVLTVIGRGFMRYQIRMIMGALIQLGKGERSMKEIEASLKEDAKINLSYIAPGSGLHLNGLEFYPHA